MIHDHRQVTLAIFLRCNLRKKQKENKTERGNGIRLIRNLDLSNIESRETRDDRSERIIPVAQFVARCWDILRRYEIIEII